MSEILSPESQRAALKELSHAWEPRYQAELEKIFSSEHIDLDTLVDVMWEKGILERISPINESEKQARVALGRPVWEGGRNDPELYWKLMYAAGYTLEAMKRSYSGLDQYVGPATTNVMRAAYQARNTEVINDPNKLVEIVERILVKAKQKISELGDTPHEKPIPWGAKGTYKGLEVTVDMYSSDGTVTLKPVDFGQYMAHQREIGNIFNVDPRSLNPADFIV